MYIYSSTSSVFEHDTSILALACLQTHAQKVRNSKKKGTEKAMLAKQMDENQYPRGLCIIYI